MKALLKNLSALEVSPPEELMAYKKESGILVRSSASLELGEVLILVSLKRV